MLAAPAPRSEGAALPSARRACGLGCAVLRAQSQLFGGQLVRGPGTGSCSTGTSCCRLWPPGQPCCRLPSCAPRTAGGRRLAAPRGHPGGTRVSPAVLVSGAGWNLCSHRIKPCLSLASRAHVGAQGLRMAGHRAGACRCGRLLDRCSDDPLFSQARLGSPSLRCGPSVALGGGAAATSARPVLLPRGFRDSSPRPRPGCVGLSRVAVSREPGLSPRAGEWGPGQGLCAQGRPAPSWGGAGMSRPAGSLPFHESSPLQTFRRPGPPACAEKRPRGLPAGCAVQTEGSPCPWGGAPTPWAGPWSGETQSRPTVSPGRGFSRGQAGRWLRGFAGRPWGTPGTWREGNSLCRGPWRGVAAGPTLSGAGCQPVAGWGGLGPCCARGSRRLSPRRLEQPYFSANAQFFQALSQCAALQRLCLVSRSGTLQPEAVLAFMARCLRVVVCHLFTGESLATCKSLQQTLLRR